MKEHVIGEPFELDGHTFVAEPITGEGCKKCAFDPLSSNNPFAVHCGEVRCEPDKRDDDNHVRFKELKTHPLA